MCIETDTDKVDMAQVYVHISRQDTLQDTDKVDKTQNTCTYKQTRHTHTEYTSQDSDKVDMTQMYVRISRHS